MLSRRFHRAVGVAQAVRGGLPLVLLLVLWPAHGLHAAPVGGADHFTACVRHLRRAVTPQRDGSHLPRLSALRQLRDPALEPFFRRLAERAEWQVQVHAALALAEVGPNHRLDAELVSRMSERGQEMLIASAIDLDLVTPAQMRELIERDEVHPMPWLQLAAELQLAGEPFDGERLEALASGTNHRIAGLAALLAAQAGEPAILSTYGHRVAALPRRDRDAQVLWMLEAIRQYRLTGAQPWVVRTHEDEDASELVHYWSIFTLLVLDPGAGLPAWREALGPEPSYGHRVRYGMLLLAAETDVPAGTYALIEGDRELTSRIADAGLAMSRRSEGIDPTEALIALLDLGHLKTARWVMSVAGDLPPDQASRLLLHVLEIVDGESIGRADRIVRAVEATAMLFAIDRTTLLDRLARVKDDALEQEVILLGLFDVHDAAAGSAAASVRRIGAGRADALALLLTARYDERIDHGALRQLGLIASGGGRVSDGLQTQAAWLHLRHADRIDEAMGLVFD